jgi:prevent-host-death family protein
MREMATRRVSAAAAKAHLSALVGEVAYRGEHVIIERRGQPMAALVGMDDLARLTATQSAPVEPRGALALLGVQHDLSDDEIDALVDDIYAQRLQDFGRPVDIET